MRKILSLIVVLWALCPLLANAQRLTDHVDVFIGTGGHGHTYPGAVVPHGMKQLSPDTRTVGWDACSGYHYNDTNTIGFSHTHLSGTGIPDLGDVLFLPYTGELKKVAQYRHNDGLPVQEDTPRFGSSFSHEDEKALPGYYSVILKDYNVKAELTATTRAGFHRYTFPATEKAKLLIDLTRTMDNRKLLASEIKAVSDTEIQGFKQVQGWAPNRFVYFHAQFSKPFTVSIENQNQAFLSFEPAEELLVKVGLSFVDADGAAKNLKAEVADWNFDNVKENANKAWEKELSKIEVTSKETKNLTIFYTALYRTRLQPVIASDVDGRYRTMDNVIKQDANYTNYYVFSLWDTFRSLHPLNTVIAPSENQAMIRSLLRKYDEGGLLPMWELHANYTGCMIGYHAVSAIVDSYFKGQRDFDIEKAYEASKKSASYFFGDVENVSPALPRNVLNRALMPPSKRHKNTTGWIPADNPEREGESVAKGLEYAYNDWLIALFAKDLGKDEDAARFMELSKNYKHYYDPSVGFMRGKNADGSWVTPFDPAVYVHGEQRKIYCEGNAWQWLWFVPHDVDGLMELMGGREAFIEKLDALFSTPYEIAKGGDNLDITGLIGQYAHGNEPSHLTIYLYNVVGQPYKAQALTDEVLQRLYTNERDGLSGNEDCGQMSAWYILNSIGFYSYCPGIPYYSIGRPLFDEVKINLENGKVFTIRVSNNSKSNKYVASARLNGKDLDTLFFSHKELMEGGLLEIAMKDKE